MHKFGIPPSLIEAVKKVKCEQNQKHPEDVKTQANKLEPEGTKSWLATDYKKKEVKEEADICAVCEHDPCICETGQHIEEAEGGGTAVRDVKDQAKSQAERAKLTLQSAMLKLKQAKEREALSKKKKAIKESFSPAQIEKLKSEYSSIDRIDPSSPNYKKLVAMLDKLDTKTLETLAGAKIKFVSGLAQNRVNRAKMKTEELSPKQKQIDKNKNGKIDGSDLAKLRKEDDEYKTGGKPLEKKFEKSMKKQGVSADVDCKTVGNVSICSEFNPELAEKTDYEVYHKDYSSAVQTAIKQAEKRGYEVDMDDWHNKVSTGPKKPSAGKTNSFSIKLNKDGKPAKKALQMQVYNMDNHKYELNMYIEDFDINSLFSEAWKKKNEEATDADDKKSIKKGDKLTGKKEPIEIEPELKDSNNK